MKNKKYTIVTHGCQMNDHDSEKISWQLENMGYEWEEDQEKSDFIIYNTCLIRENAELRVYGQLGALKKIKRDNPDLIISVCGCMMQRKEARNIILEKHKHVDIVFGTSNIHKLPELINEHIKTNSTVVDIVEDSKEIKDNIEANRSHPFKAFVNIIYGCNNFCTYCVVPYTRGRERSREPEDILKEVKDLADRGYKEITFLGQNVNSYGKTLKVDYSFIKLLEQANKIDGIERIRFMTSHPKDLSDELIDAMSKLDKVCEHLHLPVQSGSNDVLDKMNRGYTTERYLSIIKKAKKTIPNIAISTDVIIGFPGETEEDFQKTLDLAKMVRYDSAYTFIYSLRENTVAAEMESQIPYDIKHRRFEELIDIMYPIFHEENLKYMDKVVEVLVDETSKTDDDILTGRTRTNKLVHFKGNKELIGQLVDVKITLAKSFTLEGHLI